MRFEVVQNIRRQVKEVNHLELRIYQIYEKDKQQIQIYSYIFLWMVIDYEQVDMSKHHFPISETEKILIKKKVSMGA